MGSLFEFLFKYRPIVFERGDFAFAAGWPLWIAAVLLVAISLPLFWSYLRARGRSGVRDRVILSTVRLAILALVLFCLMKPQLLVKRVIPQQSYVAVLIDDSRSMRVADEKDEPRTAFVEQSFGAQGAVQKALSDRFKVRYFRFSSVAERIASTNDLAFAGTRTRLADALDQVRQDMSGVPMAGLVVVSDGADNSDAAMTSSLLPMKASGVPVFAVGVGKEKIDRDIQVSRVETPAHVLKGSALVVDVVVSQSGYSGKTVQLNVEDAGRIVDQQAVKLPDDGEATTVRVSFTSNETGPRNFKFRITPQEGELITANNEQEAIIEVENRRDKILYFEGEPRFELKFIRRALSNDPNIQVVALQRTGENKYLRLDVDSAAELQTGFPLKREELFQYKALILGSVEASFFTHEQMQMLADFVNQRGGGLLALGGRHAFAEGGWAGTPVSEVLPVVLERGDAKEYFAEVKVQPTRAGLSHASTQIAATPKESEERWKTLPPLTVANAVFKAKPGATTLLTGTSNNGKTEHVVLAYQRYGRGSVFALPVQDSWLWQMHADVEVDDLTHEKFWQQLLRWLVHDVPPPVELNASTDLVEPGERLALTAQIADSSFNAVNDAAVNATVIAPSGETFSVPLEWDGSRDGEYRGNVVFKEQGMHTVRVESKRGERVLGRDQVHVNAAPSNAEFYNAHLNATTMKRIAEETGGRYYRPADVATLADDISYTGRGDSVTERMDLWDMPIIFIALILLLATEWVVRRVRGLA